MLGQLRVHIKPSPSRRFMSYWAKLAEVYRSAGSQRLPTKLALVATQSGSEIRDTKIIRCGVILKSLTSQKDAAFLSALLADVYTTDQYWFREFCSRYSQNIKSSHSASPRLIRYAPILDVQKEGQTTVYGLPSPWLLQHGVELRESEAAQFQEETSTDGCHLYLDMNSHAAATKCPWPILKVTDSSSEIPLGARELNSSKALTGILDFIENKRNVKMYLESLESSNFLTVTQNIERVLDNKPRIMKNLEEAVVQNIYNTDDTFEEHEKAKLRNADVEQEIANWSTEAHAHMLSEFKPRLDQFVHDQLSVSRVYTYSESKMELKLRELCSIADNSGVLNRINYLRGRLNLPLLPKTSPDLRIFDRIPALHKNINKHIYQQFFTLQLPLLVCATFGVVSGQFSAYSMGSLAILGVVLGASRIMNRWSSMLQHFKNDILDAKRVKIEDGRQAIQNEWNKENAKREIEYQKKSELLKRLGEE
ncbi:LAME_0G14730g1_1 [Lachancea meyersii CBS 8951]|uniref:LAME_0G14730g1_1 n=1 Tax=Lachancea meyersii CBS 8951 TaxID=1266667 RepID=A0A1G4KAG6_9SACH|nr:LAME_0G14730g1_1 [Lachancea meyersii CBS 8951]